MARLDNIKASIDAKIRTNGQQEITGQVLNTTLNEMVDGVEAVFAEHDTAITEHDTAITEQGEAIAEQGTKLEEQEAKLTELSSRVDNIVAGGGDGEGGGVGIYDAEVSVDDTTGTPSADATIESGVLKLSFSGLKGEKGEQGERGADGAQGAEGPQGPVGETGATGSPGITSAEVTVDDTSGTPAVTATIEDKVLKIDFSGLKGEKGAAGELEVVNDLITGGEAVALSAEQGKVLNDAISEIETQLSGLESDVYGVEESIDDITKTDGSYYSLNSRSLVANPAYFYAEVSIPDKALSLKMRFDKSTQGGIGVEFRDADGNAVGSFSNTTERRGTKIEVDIPEGAVSIIFSYHNEYGLGLIGESNIPFDGVVFYAKGTSVSSRLNELEDNMSKLDISNNLSWTLAAQIGADNLDEYYGKLQPIVSGKRDASDYYYIKGAKSITLTMIHPASSTSGGGLVFYDVGKEVIVGHLIKENVADSYTEVTYAIPSNAAYFRTTRWSEISGISGSFRCILTGELDNIALRVLALENKDLATKRVFIGSPSFYVSEQTGDVSLNDATLADIYAIYDGLVTAHPNFFARGEDIGMDATGAYPLRRYTLRMGNPYLSTLYEPSDSANNLWDDNIMSPIRIFINAGVHGNEKCAAFGVAYAIEDLLSSTETWATFIKSNFVLDICPVSNPYGFVNNTRNNGNDVNINRDFNSENPQTETVALKNLMASLPNLKVVLDSHNGIYATGVGSVNVGYIPTKTSFQYHNLYCSTTAQLAAALYPAMESLFNRPSQKPYIISWLSTNEGTLMWYTNEVIKLIGGTIEAPLSDYGITDASLNNNSKWCEVTKDLLINLITAYGVA